MAEYHYIETFFDQELSEPVKVRYLNGNLFSQDEVANVVGVNCFYHGEPSNLAGTVSANFILADGTTTTNTGTYTGNNARVSVPAAAYAIPGPLTIILKLDDGSHVTTLLALVTNVYRSATDTVVDPGDVLPSIQTLISNIQTAVDSIPADYSGLWETLAPNYEDITPPIVVGAYCTHNGGLYRCISAINSAETWTAAHWTAVDVGKEVSSLSSAFDVSVNALSASDFTFEIGKTITSTGLNADQPGMALSSVIDIANIKGIFNLTNGVGYNGKETVMMIIEYKNTTFYQRTYANSNSIYEFSDGVTNIRIIYGYPTTQNVNMTSELLNQYFSCAMIDKNVNAANFGSELGKYNVLTEENLVKADNKRIYYDITLTTEKLLLDDGRIINYSGYTNYAVSNYIELGEEEKVYVTGGADFHNGICAFYDSSKNVISVPLVAASGSTKTYYTEEPVNVPSNAKYMVIAAYLGGNHEGNAYYSDGISIKPWKGLKWCCVGDSLTERNSRTTINYADYISRDMGIEIVNMGLSGSGYKRKYDTNGAFYQRISSVPTDCDVVTIFGSGNDQEYFSSAMGTATDTGTDTLGGCINTTIDNLYVIMPTVQLGIIAPTPWADYNPVNTNNGMSRYTELLRTICANRSIPFLDLYHCSNLRPWDSSFLPYAYSKDNGSGVHPDETGHKLFAGRIREFVNSLLGTIDN